MKITEFKALCETAWKSCHGEIINLWLTEESYKDLVREATQVGAADHQMLSVNGEYAEYAPAQAALNTVRNPVTHSSVRLKLCKDKDVADIYNADAGFLFTQVL